MPLTLSVSVRHTGAEAARELSDMAERVDRTPQESMPEATTILAEDVHDEIEDIAGGVYWDIDTDVVEIPGGARGTVGTNPSKPHRIEPTKPHGLLVFEKGGETIFVRGGVNHPGSKPVDWIPGVSRGQRAGDVFTRRTKEAVAGNANLAAPVGAL
jgi:hypothetical protein